MTIRTFVALAGVAACGGSGAQTDLVPTGAPLSGEVHRAVRATAITGLTVDGRYVYGRTVELGDGAAARGVGVVAYDSAQLADTDGDGMADGPVCGDTAPHTFTSPSSRYLVGLDWQTWAEDIVPAPGTAGAIVDGITFFGALPLCDGGTGTTSEVLQVVFESWEGFDNFADLDGSDGFDTDGDGLGFPASFTDSDGDTFIDEFLGGVILTYANTDTDGDTIPDELLSNGAGGYGVFTATGLATLSLPLTSNADLWDGGKPGTDGRPDGGIRLSWTRGDGGDGLGPLNGGLYPSTRVSQLAWGTLAMEAPGNMCPYAGQPGFGVGDSTGAIWGEGQNFCGDGTVGWSEGGPSGNEVVDDQYDVLNDLRDWTNIVPDFEALGAMIHITVGEPDPVTYDCCDANADGACTPADFGAWIAAFNAMAPRCDANNDGNCTPADFGAWIAAFNSSNGGNPLICQE